MKLTLEDMAKAKYGTIEAFAKAAGRNKKRAERLLNPAATLRITELSLLVNLLDIPTDLIDPLFFHDKRDTTMEEILWLIGNATPDLRSDMFAYIDKLMKEQEATA